MGSTSPTRHPGAVRFTLEQSAHMVDRMTAASGIPLDDRRRFIAARYLQDRWAGRPADTEQYAKTFDAWAMVKSRRPDTPDLLERGFVRREESA